MQSVPHLKTRTRSLIGLIGSRNGPILTRFGEFSDMNSKLKSRKQFFILNASRQQPCHNPGPRCDWRGRRPMSRPIPSVHKIISKCRAPIPVVSGLMPCFNSSLLAFCLEVFRILLLKFLGDVAPCLDNSSWCRADGEWSSSHSLRLVYEVNSCCSSWCRSHVLRFLAHLALIVYSSWFTFSSYSVHLPDRVSPKPASFVSCISVAMDFSLMFEPALLCLALLSDQLHFERMLSLVFRSLIRAASAFIVGGGGGGWLLGIWEL